jgi:hypothetical protein
MIFDGMDGLRAGRIVFPEEGVMLTEIAIKRLKPRDKSYKFADRDGMYVAVLPSGAISFRYDYRLNGRRETLTLGAYGPRLRTHCPSQKMTVAASEMALKKVWAQRS